MNVDHSPSRTEAVQPPPSAEVILDALGLTRTRSRTSTVLTGLGYITAGAVFGSALTLLFAPTSGAVFRARIAKGARGAAGNVKNGFSAAKDSVGETLESRGHDKESRKAMRDGDAHKGHAGKSAE